LALAAGAAGALALPLASFFPFSCFSFLPMHFTDFLRIIGFPLKYV